MLASRIAAALLLGIHFFSAGIYATRAASNALELVSIADEVCSTRERVEGAGEQIRSSENGAAISAPAALFLHTPLNPADASFLALALPGESSPLFQFIAPSSRGPPALVCFQIS